MSNCELVGRISVRFGSHIKARVAELSRESGLPVSEIVRRAVENQLPVWEKNGKQQREPRAGANRRNGKV